MAPPKKGGDADSAVDGLKSVYQSLAALQLAPDAQGQVGQFVSALMQGIQKFLQQQMVQKAQQASQMQMQQRQGAGQMGGPPPGGPQAGSPPPGAGAGAPGGPPSQGSPGIAMPNPDEMRRMLATQGAGG
jgi:hypothetical protein